MEVLAGVRLMELVEWLLSKSSRGVDVRRVRSCLRAEVRFWQGCWCYGGLGESYSRPCHHLWRGTGVRGYELGDAAHKHVKKKSAVEALWMDKGSIGLRMVGCRSGEGRDCRNLPALNACLWEIGKKVMAKAGAGSTWRKAIAMTGSVQRGGDFQCLMTDLEVVRISLVTRERVEGYLLDKEK